MGAWRDTPDSGSGDKAKKRVRNETHPNPNRETIGSTRPLKTRHRNEFNG